MTLTIHKEEDEQRQLVLTVEVDESRVEAAMRRTARKLARDINVPGFRRGKAPYRVIVRRVGRDTLRAETIEDMVPSIFEEAMAQVEAEPYAQPRLDDMEAEPLMLKFVVPLSPQVELGDYRSIRKFIEPVDITDEAVGEALEQVRIRHQELEPVDRPAEPGDIVTVSGKGYIAPEEEAEAESEAEEAAEASEEATADGEEMAEEVEETAVDESRLIFDQESFDLLLDSEKVFTGTPFVENLVGLSAGDEKRFSFVFPEEYEEEDLAGEEATFTITVLNVKRRELPELDDELAKLEGDFETVEELRDNLRQRLEDEAKTQARDELIEEMVDDLLEEAEIVYPPAAVESEIDDMIETYKTQIARSGWQWEDFVQLQGQTEEAIREDFWETAETRLQRQLVLRQFVLDEKLTVEAEDIDAAVEERVSQFENEDLREGMRDYFRQGQGFNTISGEVLMNKVHDRIKAVVTGNAPDLDALESAEEETFDEEE